MLQLDFVIGLWSIIKHVCGENNIERGASARYEDIYWYTISNLSIFIIRSKS